MKIVLGVVASILIGVVTLAAMAPWGAPDGARFVMPLLPYMAAHVFLARGLGVVPSPVLFVAGLFVDLATHGPLGFWALIYLSAALVARHLPAVMQRSILGRLGGLGAIVLVLIVFQVALASLYKFEWVDWQGVIAGTSIAALPLMVVDLLWRPGRDDRSLNVTDRGGGSARRVG
jgi:uncharacterized membrane protein YccC